VSSSTSTVRPVLFRASELGRNRHRERNSFGKGGHVRTVPVPDWVRSELDDLLDAAVIDRGRLFRRVNKVGKALEKASQKGGLAHRGGICEMHWSREVGTARSESDLCPALPPLRRRIGADPISFGARVGSKRPSAISAVNSVFVQPSMIASELSPAPKPPAGYGRLADDSGSESDIVPQFSVEFLARSAERGRHNPKGQKRCDCGHRRNCHSQKKPGLLDFDDPMVLSLSPISERQPQCVPAPTSPNRRSCRPRGCRFRCWR
jgi:hypothetical protein